MSVEAGRGRRPTVLGAVEAGQRDDAGVRPEHLAQAPGHLEAIETGQAKVQEHDIGTAGGRQRQALRAVGGHRDRLALGLERELQDFARVGVVLDDEHARPHERAPSRARARAPTLVQSTSGSGGFCMTSSKPARRMPSAGNGCPVTASTGIGWSG